MSVLVDRRIRAMCVSEKPLVFPFDENQLQPASYDVCLGSTFQVIDSSRLTPLDLGNSDSIKGLYQRVCASTSFSIGPKGFVLACTMERVCIPPYIVGRIEGKSSIARSGLIMESAGYLDPGFEGRITLEIYNQLNVTVIVHPGMRIAQLSFDTLDGRPDRIYGDSALGSHYQGDDEATPPRFGS